MGTKTTRLTTVPLLSTTTRDFRGLSRDECQHEQETYGDDETHRPVTCAYACPGAWTFRALDTQTHHSSRRREHNTRGEKWGGYIQQEKLPYRVDQENHTQKCVDQSYRPCDYSEPTTSHVEIKNQAERHADNSGKETVLVHRISPFSSLGTVARLEISDYIQSGNAK
jgi:hypothetical protein